MWKLKKITSEAHPYVAWCTAWKLEGWPMDHIIGLVMDLACIRTWFLYQCKFIQCWNHLIWCDIVTCDGESSLDFPDKMSLDSRMFSCSIGTFDKAHHPELLFWMMKAYNYRYVASKIVYLLREKQGTSETNKFSWLSNQNPKHHKQVRWRIWTRLSYMLWEMNI